MKMSPCAGPLVDWVTLGRKRMKSSKFTTLSWAIVSLVSAWMVIGTFWMFSSRRWAVTMTSPSASELSAVASAAIAWAVEATCKPRMEQMA